MRLVQTLPDGATVVADDADQKSFVLKAGDWERVQAMGPDAQRAEVERLVAAHRLEGDPRFEVDQQAMDTAQNASSGEAHQE